MKKLTLFDVRQVNFKLRFLPLSPLKLLDSCPDLLAARTVTTNLMDVPAILAHLPVDMRVFSLRIHSRFIGMTPWFPRDLYLGVL